MFDLLLLASILSQGDEQAALTWVHQSRCQCWRVDQSCRRETVPSATWFSHKRKRIPTSVLFFKWFFTKSVRVLMNQNRRDKEVKTDRLSPLLSCSSFVRRWSEEQQSGGEVGRWCVYLPRKRIAQEEDFSRFSSWNDIGLCQSCQTYLSD